MFLEKLKQFSENLPESLEELNLRMVEVTDELVEIITFIDFTDEDACQDLLQILEVLEFCLFRGKRERPEKASEATNEKLKVFNTLNLKIYRLSIDNVPIYTTIEACLRNNSIVTLCLLYLIDGVLDDECHEKLQNVLHSECLNAKTCPFVVWFLLAIVKSASYNLDETINLKLGSVEPTINFLPAWIPRVDTKILFCEYDRIFDMLSQIAWRCSLSGTPSIETFWLIVQDTNLLPDSPAWNIFGYRGKVYIVDQLVEILEGPKFPRRHVDKLIQLAGIVMKKNPEELENPLLAWQKVKFVDANKFEFGIRKLKSKLDFVLCLEQFQNCKNFGRQYHIAVAYFNQLQAHNYGHKKICKIAAIYSKTISTMLLAVVTDQQAEKFYSIFWECQEKLSINVRVKYCGLVELTENQQLELLHETLPELESFDDSKNMLDYLAALEILLSKILKTLTLEEEKAKIIEFALNQKIKVNQTILRNGSFFSHGALFSVFKTNPNTLDIRVQCKYLDKMRGKENEEILWNFLIEYLDHIEISREVVDKICKYLTEIEVDSKYREKFVEKCQPYVNGYYFKTLISIRSPSRTFFLSLPNLIPLDMKCGLMPWMNLSEQYTFLEECITECETSEVLAAIEDISTAINKKSALKVDIEMLKGIEEMSDLINDHILKFGKFENFQALLFRECPKTLNLQRRLAIVQKTLHLIYYDSFKLTVNRNFALTSSYHMTLGLSIEEWRTKSFVVTFADEPGVDMGRLIREWYKITTREILNPNFGLFVPTPGDINRYMINKSSHINPDHLQLFKFIGRFLAKGILENINLDCPLTKVINKHILDIPVGYEEFESQDPAFFNSLDFLLKNPISESGLDLTFSTEIEEFGELTEKELIENGKHIPVTDENKHEYVDLVTRMKMTESINPQLNEFLAGFYDVIPKELITVFDEKELEILFCGQSDIDIEDLKANTTYNNYQESDDVIQWFWKVLRSFDKEDNARFLMFTTGSSKAPINGFSQLPLKICEDLIIGANRLPTAHTCFNQLDLPRYTSYELLREKLLFAIREESEGFGIS